MTTRRKTRFHVSGNLATCAAVRNTDATRRALTHRPAAGTGFWFIAECLDGFESEPTVIANSGGQRRFQRVFRALRETSWPALGPNVADQGLALVHRTIRENQPVTAHFQAGNQRLPVSCLPVFGPSGTVHAVRIHTATPEEVVRQVPLIPLEFDTSLLAHFGSPDGFTPISALFSTDVPWTLPAVLEHVLWIDEKLGLIALFDPIEPAPRWCESLVVADPATKTKRHLWMAARSVIGPKGVPIVRAVIADLTAMTPPPSWDPLAEHLSPRTTNLSSRTTCGHGSTLMDLRTTLMHSVICHDPHLAPWRHANPQLHPDDLRAALIAVADLTAGRSVTLSLRVRFIDHGPWTTLHVSGSPLANYSRPQASIDFWIENSPP
ncbi:GAF domain-containing protein [Nocardia terpenica]|uniref:GAF domain-containing protein n=1 Tax=Nocardia terpenica TaxID=455432 RepID=UPI0012E90310|nr:GAF domain-containing protein [Nocardia terpenica]NQE85970.1 DUF5593 domain-containing protein [Nocardia terpenica]